MGPYNILQLWLTMVNYVKLWFYKLQSTLRIDPFNNVLLVENRFRPVTGNWYTIYHHCCKKKDRFKPLFFHQPTKGIPSGKLIQLWKENHHAINRKTYYIFLWPWLPACKLLVSHSQRVHPIHIPLITIESHETIIKSH